jgi:hypothetical protein
MGTQPAIRASAARLRFVVPALLAACIASVAVAGTTYWRVKLERVTVVANSSGDRCSRLAAQLIEFERVLGTLASFDSDYQPPPIVLYSLSEADADRYLISEAERRQEASNDRRIYSKYLPGRDFNIAAIVDVGSDEPLQSVLLLYAEGLLVSGPTRSNPPWFQFGVANLLNGLLIRTDGSILLNRKAQFEPIDTKHGNVEPIDLPKLLSARVADLNGAATLKEYIRLAREWAQFGLLTTPQRRSQFQELAVLMRQGAPPADAIQGSFGASLEQIGEEFRRGSWQKDVQFRLTVPAVQPSTLAPAKLEAEEAGTLLQQINERVARQTRPF